MNDICSENLSKISINSEKIASLEKLSEDDKKSKTRIFNELKETNGKVNKIDKDISLLKNSFDIFQKNMNDNYNIFREDMTSLFNSIYTKLTVEVIAMMFIGKILDKFWK